MACLRVEIVVFWDVDNVQGPLKDGKDVKVHLVSPTCLRDGKTKTRLQRRLRWTRHALLADIGLEPRFPVSLTPCLPVVC